MGGPSAEHEISLETGNAVLRNLRVLGHRAWPVLIQNEREMFRGERKMDLVRAFGGADVVFVALHGEWGEDGRIQAIFEHYDIPYTGSGPIASAFGMDKFISRDLFLSKHLSVPEAIAVGDSMTNREILVDALRQLGPLPWVVKPRSRGSSVGVSVVEHEDALVHALAIARAFDRRVIVEEYLDGPEISCGVLEYPAGYPYALPPTLIVPPLENGFFDYEAKYSGTTEEITPAPFSGDVTRAIQQTALEAFRALGCRHYARIDMFLRNDVPYILELNTLPGLTPESIIPKQARAIGFSFPSFIEHLMVLALT